MEGRKFDKKMAMLAITIIVVVVLSTFTFIIPDRDGHIRTDLVVKDYYTLESDRYVTSYVITDIQDETLIVYVQTFDKNSQTEKYDYCTYSKEDFLCKVLFTDDYYHDYYFQGAIFHDTPYGSRLCKIQGVGLNSYHVDEYGVIYYSGIGGNFWDLRETSLLIGSGYPSFIDIPLKHQEGDSE